MFWMGPFCGTEICGLVGGEDWRHKAGPDSGRNDLPFFDAALGLRRGIRLPTFAVAVSPWVTSRIVVATDNHSILQFSTLRYVAMTILLITETRRQKC